MMKVGLTGNIGSGKSTVASVFSLLGVPVFHADSESKKHLNAPWVISQIQGLFGENIAPGKQIDRAQLASLVFSDPAALTKLNSLLHPLVLADFATWATKQTAGYVIMEAAILYESGYAGEFSRIIHVSCPDPLAVARVMQRDHSTEPEIRARMRHQLNDNDKAGMADFVIINDGSRLLIPQILAVHKKILEACP
jgi:dephospho-CoA kinase